MISFEDDFEEKSAINPNWKNYEKNNSAEIQPVNQLEKTKQVRVYHSSSDEDEEEKGQAHRMFSLFLNPRIYDFFHQFSLFCLIVFLIINQLKYDIDYFFLLQIRFQVPISGNIQSKLKV